MPMLIGSNLLKPIGWRSLKRTDSNLLMLIDSSLMRLIGWSLQMQIDSNSLKQTD